MSWHKFKWSCLEVVEIYFYLGDRVGAKGVAVDSVLARIKNRCNELRDLLPFVNKKKFPIRRKIKIRFCWCICCSAIWERDLAS